MNTVELHVPGMTCGGCAAHVREALSQVAGIGQVDVDLAQGRVHASCTDSLKTTVPAMLQALMAAGYPAALRRASRAEQPAPASSPPAKAAHDASAPRPSCCR